MSNPSNNTPLSAMQSRLLLEDLRRMEQRRTQELLLQQQAALPSNPTTSAATLLASLSATRNPHLSAASLAGLPPLPASMMTAGIISNTGTGTSLLGPFGAAPGALTAGAVTNSNTDDALLYSELKLRQLRAAASLPADGSAGLLASAHAAAAAAHRPFTASYLQDQLWRQQTSSLAAANPAMSTTPAVGAVASISAMAPPDPPTGSGAAAAVAGAKDPSVRRRRPSPLARFLKARATKPYLELIGKAIPPPSASSAAAVKPPPTKKQKLSSNHNNNEDAQSTSSAASSSTTSSTSPQHQQQQQHTHPLRRKKQMFKDAAAAAVSEAEATKATPSSSDDKDKDNSKNSNDKTKKVSLAGFPLPSAKCPTNNKVLQVAPTTFKSYRLLWENISTKKMQKEIFQRHLQAGKPLPQQQQQQEAEEETTTTATTAATTTTSEQPLKESKTSKKDDVNDDEHPKKPLPNIHQARQQQQ